MRRLKTCRLCAKSTAISNLKNLFDLNQKLITQVEEITGVLLKNVKSLPQNICKTCRQDLKKAYEFRLRCISSQEYFNSLNFTDVSDSVFKDTVIVRSLENFEINKTPIVDEYYNNTKICNSANIFTLENEIKDEVAIDEKSLAEFCVESKDSSRGEDVLCNIEDSNNRGCNRSSNNVGTINKSMSLNISSEARADITKLNELSTTKEEKQKNTEIIKQRRCKKSEKATYVCDQCGLSFPYRCNFLAHQRQKHTGERIFHCEICPEKFFQSYQLQDHLRKHTGEKPFACEFCGLRFLKNNFRRLHVRRRHTNERPYVCSQCSKAFAVSGMLKRHMLTHTGEKNFKCDVCDMWFGRKTNLVKHYRSMSHKQNAEKLL